jgi:benzoyl-CoA reductase/2-hydroxyglutaryl-CoA dehydratase subunit BcrC/BadD/HgdB
MPDRYAAARRWRRRGGRVVGYFADDVPTALIEAAGLMPVRIAGDPDGGQARTMARGPIDVRGDRLEIANSWVHLIATGRYDFVDHFVISNSRKYILQLHERLLALEPAPSLHVLDRALGDSAEAAAFNAAQIVKLRLALQRWSGATITDAALAQAIEQYNERALLLRAFGDLRAEGRIAGATAMDVLIALRSLSGKAGAARLRDAIADARKASPEPAARIFLSGSAVDHGRVHAAVDQAGAVVVGENHGWGARLLETPIGDGEPWAAIAAHYHSSADFVVPLSAAVAAAKTRSRACRAQAVLSYVLEYDDAALWEAPSERAAFDLPSAFLAEQPYRTDTDAIRTAVGALVSGSLA